MDEGDQVELLIDKEEIVEKVKQFLQDGCGCSRGIKGGHCSQQFSEAAVLVNLNNCMELSHGELDLVILANIQAFNFVARIITPWRFIEEIFLDVTFRVNEAVAFLHEIKTSLKHRSKV